MKVSELTTIIENIVSNEIRKTIMEENNGKKEVYHIKCEGIPLATFESEEEANDALPDYKAKHNDGELIIEKGVYESHDDMMDKLDEMNDQLEETDNMENTQMDEKLVGNQDKLDKNHNGKIDGQDFKIMKGQDSSDEEECDECGSSSMEEEEKGDDDFENMLRGRRKHSYVDKGEETPDEMAEEKKSCEKCGKEICECGVGYMEEEDMTENKQMCNECGGKMNEEGMCNECGSKMYESKKKTVRLTESELTKLIAKMVSESIPGLDAAKKSHNESGKENQEYLESVDKKMKDYLSFDGNDNPEFPKAIGKGEKVARKNTPEQEEEIAKNYAGLENLEYDIEPSEQFKKRLKMAIEGDTLMGNGKVTEPASIKPSNGAEKGKEAKEKEGNHIQTPETAKKIEKQVKDREEDKKNRVLYSKEKVPVSESKVNFSSVLDNEIKKMKNISEYNKKTQ